LQQVSEEVKQLEECLQTAGQLERHLQEAMGAACQELETFHHWLAGRIL
jgi:hypothetical protein